MMRMTGNPAEHRLYTDLASWWPLISAPQEYTEEAATAATILNSAATGVHDVLELGSGGGHNAVHLKQHFSLTLVDVSADMLAMSRRINPECAHHQGDMRTVRLGRAFDAVFVHDAVAYMTTEDDLRQVIGTAFAHCRPGGIALFVPDHTAETFHPVTDHGGSDGRGGRGARYLEWTWDPDPGDTWIRSEYAFLLRDADGSVRVVHEEHRTGLFSRRAWLGLLADAGFHAEAITEQTSEDRAPRVMFTGHRLAAPAHPGRDGRAHRDRRPSS
jgi:SAM-dependent methyltransferase